MPKSKPKIRQIKYLKQKTTTCEWFDSNNITGYYSVHATVNPTPSLFPPLSLNTHTCSRTHTDTDTLSSLNWAPLLLNIMPICYYGNPSSISCASPLLSLYLPPSVFAATPSSAAVFLHCGQHETGLVVSPALFSNSLTDFPP